MLVSNKEFGVSAGSAIIKILEASKSYYGERICRSNAYTVSINALKESFAQY